MPETFPANTGQRDFHAALVADDAPMLHALVLAAETFPVGYGSKNTGAEQAVTFRFERAVVDGFRFCNFAVTPASDLLWAGQRDADRVKISD